jgi:hypothetical protein
MTSELWIWIVGNILMPVIPVASVFFAQLVAGKQPSIESVLRDGVLFFYSVTASALLIMDFWKDRIAVQPQADAAVATAAISTALVALIFASGAYFVTALAHTGRLDSEGKAFNMARLANLSWQSALVMVILSLAARIWSGVY